MARSGGGMPIPRRARRRASAPTLNLDFRFFEGIDGQLQSNTFAPNSGCDWWQRDSALNEGSLSRAAKMGVVRWALA
jgi:hypothetical protein